MMPRASRGSAASSTAWRPLETPRLAPTARSVSMMASARDFEIAPRHRWPHRRGDDRGRQHFDELADRRGRQPAQLHHVAPRLRVPSVEGNRPAERHERARSIADGVAHHLRELARERPLPPLHALSREDVILEHQIVGDGRRHDHQPGHLRRQRRVQQPGLRRLQLAAVASPAFGIEQQVVAPQQLGDVRLERDEIGRVLGIAADRNRAGHVLVNQPERTAEEIDAGGDDRRTHAVVVEHDRLDEIVGVALVIRRVDDAPGARGRLDDLEMLDAPIDLAQNRIERVLQRAIERIPLRRPQLFEIREDPLAAVRAAVRAPQVSHDVLAREDGLSQIVRNHGVCAL